MNDYQWAWIVVGVTTALLLLGLNRACRGWPLPGFRQLLSALLAVWLLAPAPVPESPEHFAPAFVVLLFESLFQLQGSPEVAGRILLLATIAVLIPGIPLLFWAWRRRRRTG